MGTPAQAAASRANGALSHGPLSPETKAISRRNSLKFGIDAKAMILPGEDPAALEQLTTEYLDLYKPVGPVESAVLHEAIRAQWLRSRYDRIEVEILNMRAAAHKGSEFPLGAAFDQDAKSGNALQRLFRCRQAASDDWIVNLQRLEHLQRLRKSAEHQAEMERQQLAREAATRAAAKAPAPDSRVRFENQPQRSPQPASSAVTAPANPALSTVVLPASLADSSERRS